MKKVWTAAVFILILLLAGFSIYFFSGNNEDEYDKGDWFLFVDGKETDIYVNSSFFKNIAEDNTGTKNMGVRPTGYDPYTTKEKHDIVDQMIGANYTIRKLGYDTIYRSNHSTKLVTNREDGYFGYADSSAQVDLKYSELLCRKDLINRAKKYLEIFKINISELKLNIIDSKENIRSLYGSNTTRTFLDQQVVYDQYLNGYRVSGLKGNVVIAFGSQGKLILFEDNTLKYDKIVDIWGSMRTINETLVALSNNEVGLKSDSTKILNWELVFYVPERVVMGDTSILTCYKFKLLHDCGETETVYYRT